LLALVTDVTAVRNLHAECAADIEADCARSRERLRSVIVAA
jgi:hypothetical protein